MSYLTPLTGKPKRAPFGVVDIETKDGNTQAKGFTRPFLVGIYDGTSYVSFRGPDCIIRATAYLLTKEYEGWNWFAHYGGGFDWLHFLPIFQALEYHCEIISGAGSITCLEVRGSETNHRKPWRFLDSAKLMPMGLKKVTKAFSANIQKLDFDLDTPEDDARWDEYLEHDCKGLYESLQTYHDIVEKRLGGEVGITAASTAMRTYRRAYQRQWIARTPESHEAGRAAYYGGRTEVFRKEGKGLRYYDVNSCYPWAMKQPLPTGQGYLVTDSSSIKGLLRDTPFLGIIRAVVSVDPKTYIPVLPYRHPKLGKLTFPSGTFEGWYTSAELLRAHVNGAHIQYLEGWFYEASRPFGEYVDSLYRLRDKSLPSYQQAESDVAKILLNSTYGKLGQQVEKSKTYILGPGDPIPTWIDNDGKVHQAEPSDPEDPDCKVWTLKQQVDAPYIIPHMAAFITSYARLRLHEFLCEAERLGELYYCDTDSIITTADLSQHVKPGLGALKDEGEGETFEGVFLQPKLYLLRGEQTGQIKLAMKGFRKPEKDQEQVELFERVKRKETIETSVLERLGALAAADFQRGPLMRVMKKTWNERDEKREFQGNNSRPLYVEDGERSADVWWD